MRRKGTHSLMAKLHPTTRYLDNGLPRTRPTDISHQSSSHYSLHHSIPRLILSVQAPAWVPSGSNELPIAVELCGFEHELFKDLRARRIKSESSLTVR